MSDIVEKLRDIAQRNAWLALCSDAADEIERPRIDLDRAERFASLTVAASSVAGEAVRKMQEAEAEIERLRADLRVCWNWGDPADMTLEDRAVWVRLREELGDE